jgi:hypothetical protein
VSRKVHAGFQNLRDGHRKRAFHRYLALAGVHISTADMQIKERALARTTPPNSAPGRYRPPDALLRSLYRPADALLRSIEDL